MSKHKVESDMIKTKKKKVYLWERSRPLTVQLDKKIKMGYSQCLRFAGPLIYIFSLTVYPGQPGLQPSHHYTSKDSLSHSFSRATSWVWLSDRNIDPVHL